MKHLIRSMVLLIGAVIAAPVVAEPGFARMYKSNYGYNPSCNACHKDGGGTPLNGYGEAYKEAGMKIASFKVIEAIDSDGDGDTNGEEVRAKSNPGSKFSTKAEPGDWLDTSNLIPREVQALYPGIKQYKPMDAILTEKEFAAAKKIGLELTERDQNTIYIPLNENRRPAGIAIIQPAVFEEKPFYLVVSTDGKLVIQDVVPVNTKHVPAAKESAIYAKLKGNPASKLKTPEAVDTLDDAIVMAVKKATTIIRLRLGGK